MRAARQRETARNSQVTLDMKPKVIPPHKPRMRERIRAWFGPSYPIPPQG